MVETLLDIRGLSVRFSTPAGDVRRAVSSGRFEIKGDADRTVEAMMQVADSA